VIRVLLADDQALIRAGFHVLIDAADDLEVVGEATDGAQAVDLARRERADVVLMDIRMPGVDGLEATRRISADDDLAGVKVIILTTFESDEYVYQAIRAGASGFLVKDTEPADLLQAVRVVARGRRAAVAERDRRLITDLATRPERPPPSDRVLAGLTEREREVLALVAEGLSNDEIAGRLFLSPLTAKTHVSRIMTKLNARDRAQLVVIAYESGLVTPRRTPLTASLQPPAAKHQPLSARRLRLRGLLDELALDRDLDLLADHDPAVQDRVETQPEFLPVDLRRGAVGDPVAHHPLVVELPVPGHVQLHRPGVSLDGQVAGQREPVCPGRLDARALERDHRVLLHLEEVRRAEVVVPGAVVGPDAGRGDGRLDRGSLRGAGSMSAVVLISSK
jgi:DNA-binding NarL/FixJ family response regulator